MPTSQEVHFTFDLRNAAITTKPPTDVHYPTIQSSGTFDTEATAGSILNIPGDLDWNPNVKAQRWSDIVAEKNLAILSKFPGFTGIMYNDMADVSAFNTASLSGVILGARGSTTFGDTGSSSTASTTDFAYGAPVAQGILWAETFMYMPSAGLSLATAGGYSDPKHGRCRRFYRSFGTVSTFLQFDVSFNAGSTWITNVIPQALFNIPVPDQGGTFRLRITRKNVGSPTGRIGLGAFAFIF